VIGALHLIALTLHALRSSHRVEAGVDYLDIIQLVRLKRIDIGSPEFQEVVNRYNSELIRNRLYHDLK